MADEVRDENQQPAKSLGSLSRLPHARSAQSLSPVAVSTASSRATIWSRIGFGEYSRASGPNERTQDTKLSVSAAGTSTSTQPSFLVRTIFAPAVSDSAHHASFGLNEIRAVAAGFPRPHGPASSCAAASNPGGGGEAGPASFTAESRRESRN